jgi:hypothetical protein
LRYAGIDDDDPSTGRRLVSHSRRAASDRVRVIVIGQTLAQRPFEIRVVTDEVEMAWKHGSWRPFEGHS